MTEEQAIERIKGAVYACDGRGPDPNDPWGSMARAAWNEMKAIAREGIEGTEEWYRSEYRKMSDKLVENGAVLPPA